MTWDRKNQTRIQQTWADFIWAACYAGMKNHFARICGRKNQLRNDGHLSDDEGDETPGAADTKKLISKKDIFNDSKSKIVNWVPCIHK